MTVGTANTKLIDTSLEALDTMCQAIISSRGVTLDSAGEGKQWFLALLNAQDDALVKLLFDLLVVHEILSKLQCSGEVLCLTLA
jgi:hypothetical protein